MKHPVRVHRSKVVSIDSARLLGVVFTYHKQVSLGINIYHYVPSAEGPVLQSATVTEIGHTPWADESREWQEFVETPPPNPVGPFLVTINQEEEEP